MAGLLKIQNAGEFSPGINFQVSQAARTAEQIRRRELIHRLEEARKFDALPVNKPKRLLRNVCVKGKGVEKKFLTVRRVLRDFYIYICIYIHIYVMAFSGYNKKKGATLDRVSLSLYF